MKIVIYVKSKTPFYDTTRVTIEGDINIVETIQEAIESLKEEKNWEVG